MLHVLNRKFAFFSETADRETRGSTTVFGVDQHGRQVKANWLGSSIAGLPGIVRDGSVKRPPDYDKFVCIGEIDLTRIDCPDDSAEELQRPKNYYKPAFRCRIL